MIFMVRSRLLTSTLITLLAFCRSQSSCGTVGVCEIPLKRKAGSHSLLQRSYDVFNRVSQDAGSGMDDINVVKKEQRKPASRADGEVAMLSMNAEKIEPISTLAGGCQWRAPQSCRRVFFYKGKKHKGCLEGNDDSAWCSHHTRFQGQWSRCENSCGRGRSSDQVALYATFSERGYKDVAMTKSHSAMESYIRRVARNLGCNVADEGSLQGLVPYYSGEIAAQSFDALEAELYRACVSRKGSRTWLTSMFSSGSAKNDMPILLARAGHHATFEDGVAALLQRGSDVSENAPVGNAVRSKEQTKRSKNEFVVHGKDEAGAERDHATDRGKSSSNYEAKSSSEAEHHTMHAASQIVPKQKLHQVGSEADEAKSSSEAEHHTMHAASQITPKQKLHQVGSEADEADHPRTSVCKWQAPEMCLRSFVYLGMRYNGCVTGKTAAWCSHDKVYKGKKSSCKRVCGGVTDASSDLDPDEVAVAATFNNKGYNDVAKLKDHSAMETYIRRVVSSMGCRVAEESGLEGVIPYYSGEKAIQTFGNLEAEIYRACTKKDSWLSSMFPHSSENSKTLVSRPISALQFNSRAAPPDVSGSTAPITEEGMKNVVLLGDELKLQKYIRRVIDGLHGVIVDESGLHGLIPFYSGEKAALTLGSLITELAATMRKPDGWIVKASTAPTAESSFSVPAALLADDRRVMERLQNITKTATGFENCPDNVEDRQKLHEIVDDVPLSQEGYEALAALRNDCAMMMFMMRVVQDLQCEVVEESPMKGMVPFYSGTQGMQDYIELHIELQGACHMTDNWIKPSEVTVVALLDHGQNTPLAQPSGNVDSTVTVPSRDSKSMNKGPSANAVASVNFVPQAPPVEVQAITLDFQQKRLVSTLKSRGRGPRNQSPSATTLKSEASTSKTRWDISQNGSTPASSVKSENLHKQNQAEADPLEKVSAPAAVIDNSDTFDMVTTRKSDTQESPPIPAEELAEQIGVLLHAH